MLRALVSAGLAAVALVVTGIVIRAAGPPGTPESGPKVIQAGRFELVDGSGRIRGRFGLTDGESPEVTLLDADGKARATVRLDQAGEPRLELLDAKGAVTFAAPVPPKVSAGEKTVATSADVEAHGSWRRTVGRHGASDAYAAEGEVTNTGTGIAPLVTVTATFKGATLVRRDSSDTYEADDFVYAEASTVMRNLRPGETRRYFLSALDEAYRSASAIVDAKGRRFDASAALDGALDCAVVTTVSGQSARE